MAVKNMQNVNKKSLNQVSAYTILGLLLAVFGPLFFSLSKGLIEVAFNERSNPLNVLKGSLEFGLILSGLCLIPGAMSSAVLGIAPLLLWQKDWKFSVFLSPVIGFVWAIVTGLLGGFLFLIIGGLIGAIVAIPYGVLGFTIFASVYEPLSRRRFLGFLHVFSLALGLVIPLSLIISVILALILEFISRR